MKDYDTWSFWNRSFFLGLFFSLLWHVFWFFSVQIAVSPEKAKIKTHPKVVSLGAVLDDAIFKTLVETKPQFSETFYRQEADFTTPLEPVIQKIERHAPGDVVSVPMGQRFMTSLRGLVGGRKSEPVYEFVPRIAPSVVDDASSIEGEVRSRKVVTRPTEPLLRPNAPASLKSAEVEILFTVDTLGAVTAAEVASSSGDAESDLLWVRYLKDWQFAPLDLRRPAAPQTGRARFRISGSKGQEAS